MYHNPSDGWDKKEKKMDESDMAEDKEKIDVVTEEHEHGDIPFSGMFCTICRDHATFLFEGDSLCWSHYDEKLADILKQHKESKK